MGGVLSGNGNDRCLPTPPKRKSTFSSMKDLLKISSGAEISWRPGLSCLLPLLWLSRRTHRQDCGTDRKSTRLNSSHVAISYAVFCLKKKKKHRMKPQFCCCHAI